MILTEEDREAIDRILNMLEELECFNDDYDTNVGRAHLVLTDLMLGIEFCQ